MTSDLSTDQRAAATAFSCSDAVAAVVIDRMRERRYPAHGRIIDAGVGLDQLYLVFDGRARMYSVAASGRMLVVETFSPGELFGEGSLIEAHEENELVEAIEAVRLGAIASTAFIMLMSSYNEIAMAFSRLMVARLGRATRRLVEGATLSANGRICAELLRQAQAGIAMTITPAPVLSVFAQGVQSTRETVSRMIGTLEKRGIISRSDAGLRVVAPHRLEELVY